MKNKINRFIWAMPELAHDIIFKLTGWRLVEIKEIADFQMLHTSFDGYTFGTGGIVRNHRLVLEWHKEYPIK
jgi:hypothetical protein